MADKIVTPEMVSLPIPKGMTKDQVEKLFGTFAKQRITGKAKDKATRDAMTDLKKAHAAEFKTLYDKHLANPSSTK